MDQHYAWEYFYAYLSFRQTQVDSQFGFPPDGDVSVEVKLLLQLQPLMVCVHHPVFLLRSCFTWEQDKSIRWGQDGFIYLSVCFYLNDRESADSRLGLDRPGLSERRIVIQPRPKSTSSLQIRKLSCFWSSSDDKANFKEPGLDFLLVIKLRLKLGTNMWKLTVKQLNLFYLFVFKLSCKRETK